MRKVVGGYADSQCRYDIAQSFECADGDPELQDPVVDTRDCSRLYYRGGDLGIGTRVSVIEADTADSSIVECLEGLVVGLCQCVIKNAYASVGTVEITKGVEQDGII
jgi:hypothetical protein